MSRSEALRVGDRIAITLDGTVEAINPNGVVDIDLAEHGEVRIDDGESWVGDRIEVVEEAPDAR